MKFDFSYIIEKIENASFLSEPFSHIEISELFSQQHFEEIINSHEIQIPQARDDEELCRMLETQGWEPIRFPGGTVNVDEYINWRKGRGGFTNVETCEGFGIVFRLVEPASSIITDLKNFLCSDEFLTALSRKFYINQEDVVPDVGIQKYLDGYEISLSLHPDIKSKALTFMVNINPHVGSESADHHTHYLRFKDEFKYVETFWEYNEGIERAWVPWEWCESKKTQHVNNSMVIFKPGNDTMHAVRAKYDHLSGQRTQLYGNLWYGQDLRIVFDRKLPQIPWQGLKIDTSYGDRMLMTNSRSGSSMIRKLKGILG